MIGPVEVGILAMMMLAFFVFVGALVVVGVWIIRRRGTRTSGVSTRTSREAVPWLMTLLATLGSSALLFALGLSLGVFGLPLLALLGAALLTAAAVFVWRRGALPLALAAASLAGGAALATADTARVAPSSGLLTVHATKTADVAGKSFRRGFGSVFVDLRDYAPDPDSVTAFRARSDQGRVVVALPPDRCFNLRLTARNTGGAAGSTAARWVALAAQHRKPMPDDEQHTSGLETSFSPVTGPNASTVQRNRGLNTQVLALYGQEILAADGNPVRSWVRRSNDPHAPWLDLKLTAGTTVIVRDYPRGRAVLGRAITAPDEDNSYAPYNGYPALRYADQWPAGNQPSGILPRDPWQTDRIRDLRNNGAAWPKTKAGQRSKAAWTAWYQKAIPYAARAARLAAGPCATSKQRANSWLEIGSVFVGTSIKVNGNGKVVRS